MDEKTRSYLSGRVTDYYQSQSLSLPPNAGQREWGYIPWNDGDTIMNRHYSLPEIGEMSEFTVNSDIKHIYFSASYYEYPGANSMDEKQWTGSDLVFDLDADHLATVESGSYTYSEMLSECKHETQLLLDMLEDDLGFDDITVVFSGGRGFHVHVRDDDVKQLTGPARSEIVRYVTASNVTVSDIYSESVHPEHRTHPINDIGSGQFQFKAGWPSRVFEEVAATIETLTDSSTTDEHRERILAKHLPNTVDVGDVTDTVKNNAQTIRAGLFAGTVYIPGINSPVLNEFLSSVIQSSIDEINSEIDEPVTTDVNRLIRLPESLHGGTCLKVSRIPRNSFDQFNPTSDPIPSRFKRTSVTISPTDSIEFTLNGEKFTLEKEREQTVPEYAGLFAMARGNALRVD